MIDIDVIASSVLIDHIVSRFMLATYKAVRTIS